MILQDTSGISLKRIRILKTGLYRVNRYLDMSVEANRIYFERLATPGTELKLKRVKTDESNPWRIDVYGPDDMMLGTVTRMKCQTAARLIDAGFEVIGIVNDSLPHNSDYDYGKPNVTGVAGDVGWTEECREQIDYTLCNLPYGIYLVEE